MFKLANSPAVAGSNKCSHVFYIQGEILRNLRKGQTGVFKGASPLTVSTLWGLVFLSFGSFSILFAFKKKENEQAENFEDWIDCHVEALASPRNDRSYLFLRVIWTDLPLLRGYLIPKEGFPAALRMTD